MAFHPYLNFGGNCRAAFTRYQEIFGGELVLLAPTDLPPGAAGEVPPGKGDLVMHAALTFEGHLLMGSDDTAEDFGPVRGMYVNITVVDATEARRVFEALAEEGEVEMRLEQTFFSPLFGVCRDRFGTPWMVDTEAPEPPPAP